MAFLLAVFAISVAWLSYSWLASAFGTDDWLHRVLTMLQMMGVVVFALGIPAMFASISHGHVLDIRAMVIGYVIMRIALVALWSRTARDSAQYRRVARANIGWTVLAQVGWLIVGFARPPLLVAFVVLVLLGLLELLLPTLAQGAADGTPWHPHHIAERYGLFAIITLGEGVVGTVASSAGLLGGPEGTQWNGSAVGVLIAGVGLTFGMWWVYFMTPFGEVLAHRQRRGYLFGYGHIAVFVGIAGAGAGLRVVGSFIEHDTSLGPAPVLACVAVPVSLYLFSVYALHTLLLSTSDRLHLVLLTITLIILGAAVLMADIGVPITVCLLVVALTPFVTVLGFETLGRHHQQHRLAELASATAT